MEFETPWAALDFDLACLYVGRQSEKAIHDGKKPFNKTNSGVSAGSYASGEGMVKKKVRIKKNGTW